MASHDGGKRDYSAASKWITYYQAALAILANSIDDRAVYRLRAASPPAIGAYGR
jgi:hypothetical protein